MSYYNFNAIAQEAVLENSRQHQLTSSCTFKILETGVRKLSSGVSNFVVRIVRNVKNQNGNPYVLYVDMSKYEFDQITKEAGLITHLLQNGINKTVFQSANVHVWTQRASKNDPHNQSPMLCFRGVDGIRIYIIESTFHRLINRVDSVERAYARFTGNLADDASSHSSGDTFYSDEYDTDEYYDYDDYDDYYSDDCDGYYDSDYFYDDYEDDYESEDDEYNDYFYYY